LPLDACQRGCQAVQVVHAEHGCDARIPSVMKSCRHDMGEMKACLARLDELQEECVLVRTCVEATELRPSEKRAFHKSSIPEDLLFDKDIIFDESIGTGDEDEVAFVRRQHMRLTTTKEGIECSAKAGKADSLERPLLQRLEGEEVEVTRAFVREGASQQPRQGSTAIEFKARRCWPSGEMVDAAGGEIVAQCTVLLNDRQVLAERIKLGATFRVFRFVCDSPDEQWSRMPKLEEPIWRVALDLRSGPCGAELDPTFGLRMRGEDLLHTVVPHAEEDTLAEWRARGASMSFSYQEVRLGRFVDRSMRYIAETSLEFVAHGLSGKEQVDVYVNGLTVPCELGITLGRADAPQLLRFSLAPASCAVRSVVIQVSKLTSEAEAAEEAKRPRRLPFLGGGSTSSSTPCDEEFGVVIDTNFGVMVGGLDCLPSAVFVTSELATGHGSGAAVPPDVSQDKIQDGQWLWKGLYVLMPYRRTKKPLSRSPEPEPPLATQEVRFVEDAL